MPLVSNDTVLLIPDLQTEPVAYLCKATSVFEASGKIINETSVESVVSVRLEMRNRDGYVVHYQVTDNYWQQSNTAAGKTSAFIRKMAALMQELVLQLDFNGTILSVLNKEEIWDAWLGFKKTTVRQFDFNPRVEKEVITRWEEEFRQLDAKISTGIPYSLFFHGLYGEKKLFNGVFRTTEVMVPSKLFYGIHLRCRQQEKTTAETDDRIRTEYLLEMESFDQPVSLVKQKLQFIYNLDTGTKIPYHYTQALRYELEQGTGMIHSAAGTIREVINEDIFFRQDIAVSKIGGVS